jgi:hypothetical protein
MLFLLFAVCLFAIASWGKPVNATAAKVEGTVFVKDCAGNQSVVAGASVKLSGPSIFETESDENGKYVIAAVPLGSYTVEAVSPGLKAVQTTLESKIRSLNIDKGRFKTAAFSKNN